MTAIIPRTNTSTTQLTGGRLLATRVVWGLVAIYSLGLTATVIARFLNLASGGAEYQAALRSLGLPAATFAAAQVALAIVQTLVFFGVAINLYLHKSNEWMTFWVSSMLITFGCFGASYLAQGMLDANGPLPYLIGPAVGLSNGLFASFLYCMPDGKFNPDWIRWPVRAWIAASLIMGFFPGTPLSPFSWPPAVTFLVYLAIYIGSVLVQLYRNRHVYSAVQRQQVKWIMLGLLFALVAGYVLPFWPPLMFPALNGTGAPGLIFALASRLVGTLAVSAFPITLAFSVTRYRLWDVDVMIHRGAVYGALTALLIVLFAASVLVVQLVASHLTGGMQSGIGLLASGVVFGALFSPTRRWLRTQVDHHLYGIQVNYHTGPDAVAAPSTAHFQAGSKLGVYEVVGLIGRGGMAEVYKGQHSTLSRTVAIKVLPPDLAEQADFRKRFEREARLIAALNHPNIVRLFDFGEADGTYFMVMEYIAGDSLAAMLRARGPLPLDESRTLLCEVASALSYAHQQGIVHRDVKPSNVMVQPDPSGGGPGRAILTDFGIARLAGSGTRITSTGLVGTFDYMSPEQIRDAKDVDGRADIYSLGVMSFQVLTGRLPFQAGNAGALLIAHLQQPAPDPRTIRPELPEEVADALLKALEKDPDRRFETADAFARALRL